MDPEQEVRKAVKRELELDISLGRRSLESKQRRMKELQDDILLSYVKVSYDVGLARPLLLSELQLKLQNYAEAYWAVKNTKYLIERDTDAISHL